MAQALTVNYNTIYSCNKIKPFFNKQFFINPQLPYSVCTSFELPTSPFHLSPNLPFKISRFLSHPTFKRFCSTVNDKTTSNSICSEIMSCELTDTDPLKSGARMTVTGAPYINHAGSLMVNGKVLLTHVPANVSLYPVADGGAFLGANSSISSARLVFQLGLLQEYKFTCLFRHKIWWMIPRFGSLGSDIPFETQMLLLEVREDSAVCRDKPSGQFSDNTFYVLFLPVLEGQFRATLQGTTANELQLCVESGDTHVQTSQVFESVFINSGDNPFELIENSIMILERRKGTFTHIKHKKKPTHLDWFGWCTWDAFYKDVNPRGIKQGLESFLEGGCPPKFLIIDDGWQDTINEFEKDGQPLIKGQQFSTRLVDIKECSKFMSSGADIQCNDLHEFVKFIKENYNLKSPSSSEKLKKYNSKITYPVQSPGNIGNLRDIAMDSIEKYGVGLIDPKKIYDFYNDLHSYLSNSGVDGVKVDVQNVVETLGSGNGGRVELTRQYQEALEESVGRNFKENNLICCMSHNSDSIYSSRRSATARASEDFMPREPTFQTLHIASVAFNSLLLGEIVVPDWDMFQSNHYAAEFHGAARALGGCAVYVSDKPGLQDFKILKKLVLPDGLVLRAKYAGRPTRDCLFLDTVMDGKSLLKIWNLNKLSGVVGVFNCQGSGNWPLKDGPEYNSDSSSKSIVLSGHVSPLDVDFLGEVADECWRGDCAVYAFHAGSLSRLSKEESLSVSLGTLECEIFTVSPVRVFDESLQFAPIGLIDMYNSGGATEGLSSISEPSGCTIRVEARGCGRFGAYSSKKPTYCLVGGENIEFKYDSDNGLLIVKLEGECRMWDVQICY